MTKRIGAGEVGDRNIAMAADTRPPKQAVGIFEDATTLHLPRRLTRTQEQKARADELDAIERRKASWRVAKFTMLLTHGCRGKSCRSAHHADDRDRYGGREEGGEGMHALLSMLGLREAPETTGLPP